MDDLHEDIKAAIDKSLPAEVGDRLKERLNQAHDTEVELKGTKEYLRQARVSVAELTQTLSDAENLYLLRKDLTTREREVEKKELRIELVEQMAKAAEDKASAIEGLVSTVFSNRRIVHTMTRSAPFVRDGYVSQEQTSQTDETSDEQAS